MSELLDLGAQAVERALAAGASAASASASRSRDVEYAWRDGKLESVKDATSRGLYLTLYVDGRYSGHSTSDLRPDAIDALVRDAVALTRALQPDPQRALPDPSLYPKALPDLKLADPGVAALTREDRLAWLQEADAAAREGEARVLSSTSSFSDGTSTHALVTSNGFQGEYDTASVWADTTVTVRDEGDKRPEDSQSCGGRTRAALLPAREVATQARERAISRLGSKKGPSRTGVMVVDPRAAISLVGRLLGPANARSIQQQQSMYAGKIGQKLVSDKLTIIDDPLIVGGLASRPFDGEGLAARVLPIIEGGVLRDVYADTYYAKKAGLPVTTGGGSNRRIALGDRDLNGWLSQVGTAVYVTSWLGGNADPTTGAFSFGLRGFLVEGGKIGAPVGEMNVTGSLISLFAGLAGVGNDPYPYSATACPTLVFEGVSFSGA